MAAQHVEVFGVASGLLEGDGFVVVVQVEPGTRAVEIPAEERGPGIGIGAADRSHVGHRVEQRRGVGRSRAVRPGGGDLFREQLPVAVGKPGQRRHPELVGRRGGRGVQKPVPGIVEQVLAMVGAVEQGRHGIRFGAQEADGLRKKTVRVEHRIVVGVAEPLRVVGRNDGIVVGQPAGLLAGVAAVVAEVRAVAVEDEKHLPGPAPGDGFAHDLEQLHVVARSVDVDPVVGIGSQMVDHGALTRLVGDEPGFEARLGEERRQSLAAVEFVVAVRGNRREHEGHALVGGVALGQHVAERQHPLLAQQARRGFAPEGRVDQPPAHRPGGFADDIDVDFAAAGFGFAHGAERESFGGPGEMPGAAELAAAQTHVVEGVQREDFVPQHAAPFIRTAGGPQRQGAQQEKREPREPDRLAGRGRQDAPVPDLAGGEPQKRQVDHTDERHPPTDVAQHFVGFARIGREQVGEHVGGDDRIAENAQQHDFERAEEDEGKAQPDHDARTPERDAPHHVEPEGHEDERLDRPGTVILRVGQHAVGQNERRDEPHGQKNREAAARAFCDAPRGTSCGHGSEGFVEIHEEAARLAAETVVEADVDPLLQLPAEADAVVGERLAPVEAVEAREDVARAAPHRAADAPPDALAQFDLESNHIVVHIAALIVAAQAPHAARTRQHRPGRARGVELSVEIGGQNASVPHLLVTVDGDRRAQQPLAAVAQRPGEPGFVEAQVDAAIGIGDEVARIVFDEHSEPRGRVAVVQPRHAVEHAAVGRTFGIELLARRMLEIELGPHVGAGQHLVHVVDMHLVLLFGVVARPVVASGRIAHAPHVARLGGEHERVVDLVAVVGEEVVAPHAQRIAADDGDGAENRYVGGRRERIGPVDAVETRGQHAEAQARVFRVARAAREGEVDLLDEGAVLVRPREIVDEAVAEAFADGGLGGRFGQRGVGEAGRVGRQRVPHRSGGCRPGVFGGREPPAGPDGEERHDESECARSDDPAHHPLSVSVDHLIESLLVGFGELTLAQEDQLALFRDDHQHELVVAVAQPPGAAQDVVLVGQHGGAVLFGAFLGHRAGHAVGHHWRILEVHHAESVDVVARGAVRLFELDREILVLLMAVGVHIENQQVLLSPVGQAGRTAVQIENLHVTHFPRQLLGCERSCAERQKRRQEDGFHLHRFRVLCAAKVGIFFENRIP